MNYLGVEESTLSNELELTVYPNPASNLVTLSVTSINSERATIEIRDSLGKLISSSVMNVNAGLNTILIDVSNLNSGVYHLSLLAKNQVVSESVVIE